MKEKFLVAIEISEKQKYIFKNNRLKENIGASLIIKYVIENLWKEFSEKENGREVYSGGGNCYLQFDYEEQARNFIKKMSFHILKYYEGLEFYGTKVKGQFSRDNINLLKKKLNSKKFRQFNSFRKVSFGVEEICKSTSTPAIREIKEKKFKNEKNKSEIVSSLRSVSQEAWIKNGFFDYLNKGRNSEYFKGDIEKKDYFRELYYFDKLEEGSEYKKFTDNKFPLDLDDFGEDKNNQIALVNIDGNRVGDMISILEEMNDKDENRLKNRLETFSNFIKDAYTEAFDRIINEFEINNIRIKGRDGEKKLPIRPIILAGDDVTYIVDSRYALESVKIFTESIENKRLLDTFEEFRGRFDKLTIGAGVVFVNKKAPFYKAYEMAEELCKGAKALGQGSLSTIDWHILKGEFDDVDNIRKKVNNRFDKKDENLREKELFLRPMKLFDQNTKNEEISLEKVLSTIKYINNSENRIRVNKLGELLSIFDEEETKTDLFVNKYKLKSDIKKINEHIGYKDLDRPYKGGRYHLHDIIELCNDKYYRSLKGGEYK